MTCKGATRTHVTCLRLKGLATGLVTICWGLHHFAQRKLTVSINRVKFTRRNTQIFKYSDVSEVRQRIAKPNPIRAPTWDALPLQTDMPSFSHSPFANVPHYYQFYLRQNIPSL